MLSKDVIPSYYHPEVERLSREELLGLQWRRLKLLLEYTYYKVPFYRSRFLQAGLTPEDIGSMEDFRRLPFTGKADLLSDQRESPPFGKALAVGEEKLGRIYTTSGTSGKGQQVMGLTPADIAYLAVRARGYHWFGIRRGHVVAHCGATTLGLMAGTDSCVQTLNLMGANCLHLDITFSTEKKVEYIRRFRPDFIQGGTRRMIAVCRGMGVDPHRDLPHLKGVRGEVPVLSVPEIQEAEDFWGCRMHCTYGTTESRTTFGFTCEHGMLFKGRPGIYHLAEDRILVEVLDRETRQPVAFGEEGEVVITTLLVEASPVLRFALGDRAVSLPPSSCDCSRPFAGLEVGSIHRYDDMVKIRGMNLWPTAVDGVVFSHPIAEYQAAVWLSRGGGEEVTLAVEFLTKVSVEKKAGIMSELSRLLKDGTGLRIDLEEAPYPLPQFPFPQKPRRWRDLRSRGNLPQPPNPLAGGKAGR